MTECWYRYEDHHTAPPLDEFDNPVGRGGVVIEQLRYEVIKYTPKGVWIRQVASYGWFADNKRFVLRSARKRFACPTVEEARVSFLARKKKQLSILSARAQDVRDAVDKAVRTFRHEDTLSR